MKIKRPYAAATLSAKAEKSVRSGHPWIFGEEIVKWEGDCENGDIVDVFSANRSYLGSGILSQHSKIRVRLLSQNANDLFDEAFFERRLRYAVAYRQRVMGAEFNCTRLVFGDSDGLPGLIVDRFENILVAQVLSYGMELRKALLFRSLLRVLAEFGVQITGILERNDVSVRTLEGLEQKKSWFHADFIASTEDSFVRISENGILYDVDLLNGQKTGYFLDQKYNRLAVMKLAHGLRVLDCCTHTGSFALNAARGGATEVVGVDVSELALQRARSNAELNHLDANTRWQCANVFELLPAYFEQREHFDLIILDPPAFTKSRANTRAATSGYKEINYRAMKLLPRGGYLVTCSCSHFMQAAAFLQMLREAAHEAGVSLRLIEARSQAPDHPSLLNVPETEYLKCYLLQIQ